MRKSGERRVASEEWNAKVFSTLHSPLFTLHLKRGQLKLNSLNKHRFSLISLTILLIMSVDNSVDKLWISCGWSCG